MAGPASSPWVMRFGVFEVDLRAGELRKSGVRVKLQEQPLQVLSLLLQQPGAVVTREELQQKLWPADTFVDFDHSLNTAIAKLREALGDSAESPRYVETLPRRGYRLIAPVERLERPARKMWRFAVLAGAVVVVLLVLFGLNVGGLRERMFGPASGRITSVAVLPLKNMSGDPEQDYFSDGITEDIISQLAGIPGLRVISHISVEQYKNTTKSSKVIADGLDVNTILEGSVRREGNRVRIVVQLIDARKDEHLWGETYDRELKDIFAVESEVARAIAQQVRVKVTPEQHARLGRHRPVVPEAYEAYLQGRQLLNYGQHAKSIPYFEEAIRKDPDFALAYADVAEAYGWEDYLTDRHGQGFQKAQAAARKALELDETLGQAHIRVADFKFYWGWDWTGGEAEFRRAVELDPGSADAAFHYANCLRQLGRRDAALREYERAHQLDPVGLATNLNFAAVLRAEGQYQRAIELLQKLIDLNPKAARPYDALSEVYQQMGRSDEEATAFLKARTLDGTSPAQIKLYEDAFRTRGIEGFLAERRAVWKSTLEQLKEKATQERVPPLDFARTYIHLGQKDQAFQWLETAYAERSPRLTHIRSARIYAPLRSDPRYLDLVRRMNFPP